jgi:Ca-activated chloride channel homolog
MRRCTPSLLGLLLLLFASQAWAQGVLIIIDPPEPVPLPRPIPMPRPTPAPPAISYKVKELAMESKIVDQVAQVQVSQTFVNDGSRVIQAQFVFPLPYDGAIDRLTYMVDGKEYEAKLMAKEKAREIYESYVRRNQDPALLEWVGTGMFQTSVFPIPPGAERKVVIKYSQLLRKDQQLTDFLYPLATAKYTSTPIEKLTLKVNIESSDEIKTVYSPTHAVNVQRSDSKHATVSLEQTNTVPSTDFRLFYDAAAGPLSANVLSYRPDDKDEGFFLLLASPEIKSASQQLPNKTVIFVLDRSGSMSGKKIEQARDALKFVLNNLREGDMFNIVAYDSVVESWKSELQKYNDETRKQALGFVEGIYAGGSTNIDGALSAALTQITDDSRPNFVLFLTDGLPTHGETNEAKLAAAAKAKNQARVRLISFGVGYDVNSRLLDRLARENFGQSEFVRPNQDIEASVAKVYNRMSAPVLTDVKLAIDVEGASAESGGAVSRVYPKEVHDLFAGEQIVIAGRYKKSGEAKITITGKVNGEEKSYDFPATLMEKSGDQSFAFVEKLWALRRVGEIIDQLDLNGKNDELVTELVELSTKHGILTPYTSFLADDQADLGQLANRRDNFFRTARGLERLSEAEGRSGVAQRAEKRQLQLADNLAPANSPAAGEPADASAGGRGGASFGAGPAAGGYFSGQARYRDIDTDREVAVEGLRKAGDEAVYRRGNVLIAANAKDVDPEKDADKIKTVKRFGDEYFALVTANTQNENAILAQQGPGESLVIKLRGQVYRIE